MSMSGFGRRLAQMVMICLVTVLPAPGPVLAADTIPDPFGLGTLLAESAELASAPGAVAAAPAAPAATIASAAPSALTGLVSGHRGQPVAGAQVELFRYGAGLIAAAETGADGHFTLTTPVDVYTVYWVRVWARDHGTSEQIWLPALDPSFVHIGLAPYSGSVSGVVVDGRDRAVASALVDLIQTDVGIIAHGETEADGRFRFPQVPVSGTYRVMARSTGLAPAAAGVDRIPPGGEARVRVALRRHGGRVTGTVVDQVDGRPLASARIVLFHETLGMADTTTTGAAGEFALDVQAAPGGRYHLTALASGYHDRQTEPFTLDDEGRAVFSGQQRLELAPLHATVIGRAVNKDQESLGGLSVWLEREGRGIVASATVAADDGFRFTGVAADGGRYRLRMAPGAYVTDKGNLKRFRPFAGEWFTPVSGDTVNQSLVLTRGEIQDYGRGWVRGRIVAAGGEPVAGVTVTLIRSGDGAVATGQTAADGSYRFDRVAANQPDPNDPSTRFFDRQPGNGLVVHAAGEGFFPAASDTLNVWGEKETLADLDLHRSPGFLLVRTVAEGGLPLAGVEVTIRSAGGATPARTDRSGPDGTLRLSLPAHERFWLEASHPGYSQARIVGAAVASDQETAVDLTLIRPLASIAGQVSDGAGRPFPDAEVTVWTPHGDPRTARSDAGGQYRFDRLPAGSHLTVAASAPGAVPAAAATGLTTAPDRQHDVPITLHRATAAVSGQVVDKSGRPVPNLTMELWQVGSGQMALTRTRPDGSFRFENLAVTAQHRFAVRATAPGNGFRLAGSAAPPPLIALAAGETHFDLYVLEPVS